MDELRSENVPTLIILGSISILLLVGCIVGFVLLYQKRMLEEKQKRTVQEMDYQNKMIQLQFESLERERKRIGADLHDSLGSLLWGAKINASIITNSSPLTGNAQESCNELTEILDESIEVVRRIAWELTPEAFQYSGLSESIKKFCERLDSPDCKILVNEIDILFWNDDRALQVFRIAQELIMNAIKHSKCTTIQVSVECVAKSVRLTVADDGVGFNSRPDKKGVGLWNIDQRVKQLAGKLNIGNPPMGSGSEISIEVTLGHGKV